MPLDPKWWSTTGPFADNVTGAIMAQTMREFAAELAAALDELSPAGRTQLLGYTGVIEDSGV